MTLKMKRCVGFLVGISMWSAAPVTALANTQPSSYTTKPVDTYYRIGHKVRQPWMVPKTINSPDRISVYPGKKIRLATPYKIHSGDTVMEAFNSRTRCPALEQPKRPITDLPWTNHLVSG